HAGSCVPDAGDEAVDGGRRLLGAGAAMTRLVSTMLLGVVLSLPAHAVEHQLSAHARTGALVHLSGSQSAGGAGFALGLRDTLDERFILGGDLGYLFLIGNALSVRLFAGVQRKGTWVPAA